MSNAIHSEIARLALEGGKYIFIDKNTKINFNCNGRYEPKWIQSVRWALRMRENQTIGGN